MLSEQHQNRKAFKRPPGEWAAETYYLDHWNFIYYLHLVKDFKTENFLSSLL